MSDLESLLLILAVLYALETVVWLRRDVTAFRSFWPGRWRVLEGGDAPEGRDGLFFWLNPLPPLGTVFLCPHPQLAISERGVVPFNNDQAHRNPPANTRAFPMDEIRRVTAEDGELRVNGRVLLRHLPPTEARRWAATLQTLRTAAPEERAPLVRAEMEGRWDRKRAETTLKNYGDAAGVLRWYCIALFLYLFVAAPLVVWWRGLVAVWLPLLLGLLAGSAFVVTEFRWARRTLAGPGNSSWLETLTLVVSPLAAIRAGDALSRHLLAEFEPLVVAHHLLAKRDYMQVAGRAVRENRYPVPRSAETATPLAEAIRSAFEERRSALLEAFVAETAGALEEFLSVPVPHPDCRSYCPRCLDQYVTPTGACNRCPGVELQPLPPEGPA